MPDAKLMQTRDFITGSGGVVASYSFTDIAERTGVVRFLGASHKEETTESHFLSQNATYSQSIVSFVNNNNVAFTKEIDEDYDVTFNGSARVRGNVRVTFSMGAKVTAGGNGQIYVIARLRKWDGSTETEIASAQTETKDAASVTPWSWTQNIAMAVPLTPFGRGDTLRLTIEVWAKNPSGGMSIAYGHDPKNRNDLDEEDEGPTIEDSLDTIMEVLIPFLLNIP